jgi:GNAT superfamily N-acetyltransferase
MNLKYRNATIEDIPQVKEVTDLMLSHTTLGLATIEKIRNIIESPQTLSYCCFDDEKLIGFIVGVLHKSLYNDMVRVTDCGLFVLPEYRSKLVGLHFVRKLESWAKINGAQQVWVGQTTGDEIDKVKSLYKAMGYSIQGFNAVKEI